MFSTHLSVTAAKVLGFTWQDAAVKVVGADGKVTLAQLPRKQFTEGAEKEMDWKRTRGFGTFRIFVMFFCFGTVDRF